MTEEDEDEERPRKAGEKVSPPQRDVRIDPDDSVIRDHMWLSKGRKPGSAKWREDIAQGATPGQPIILQDAQDYKSGRNPFGSCLIQPSGATLPRAMYVGAAFLSRCCHLLRYYCSTLQSR